MELAFVIKVIAGLKTTVTDAAKKEVEEKIGTTVKTLLETGDEFKGEVARAVETAVGELKGMVTEVATDVEVLKDKTIIIKNDTPEEMTISLQGVIKIDKILVPAGKSVGSPVFGKTGELSVINLKNNKKIGTIVVW
jgi:ribosome-associated translation inhibitor RaiA